MRLKKTANKTNTWVTALAADQNGEIFELEEYAAAGMSGGSLHILNESNTRIMPFGSELMFLPDRSPIVFNIKTGRFETLKRNPYSRHESVFPVAAFNSPGYVIAHTSAYGECDSAGLLPLFSYGAVGWSQGKFKSAVILVDPEPRQDLRQMKGEDVVAGVKKMRKLMPNNRLRKHLEKCALQYGCPAGKNFFLGRYEAPLPTAKTCNARCLGCLSLQQNSGVSHSQERIAFEPSPNEIAEVALMHIGRVKRSVVSFGQGCEGDPLLAADVIEPAIQQIRSQTQKGTINLNTNGSLPEQLKTLLDAGLDSIRISMNSTRSDLYNLYFRPKGYTYDDVLKSIRVALKRNKHVAINYLNCPGFTDTPQELNALIDLLKEYPIHMIQWRNLNFDPLRYWKLTNGVIQNGEPIGMGNLIDRICKQFPKLKHGYFNPPKEEFH